MHELDIADVARASGVPASTLRYYEEKGLITSIGRHGLRRQFSAGVLERLALIALGRAAGFSLEEIALMFAPDGRPRLDRGMLAAKADALDRRIRKLTALRDGLRHAAACPAPSHLECPKFRRILRAAGAIAARTRGAADGPRCRGLEAVRDSGPAAQLAGNCALGVEREISSSSGVMSAGTSANSGVLR